MKFGGTLGFIVEKGNNRVSVELEDTEVAQVFPQVAQRINPEALQVTGPVHLFGCS